MDTDITDSIVTTKLYSKALIPTDYILSPCSYAGLSLSILLHRIDRKMIVINTENEHSCMEFVNSSDERVGDHIIVFLPEEPRLVLVTMKYLSLLIKTRKYTVNVLLLSRLQPSWVYRTLQNLVPERKRLSEIRAIRAGTSTTQIFRTLKENFDNFPLLKQLVKDDERNNGSIVEGLTRRELDVVLNFLNGDSVVEQSSNQKLSVKTLYSQKVAGLKKLSVQFTSLVNLLPGRCRKRTASNIITPPKKLVDAMKNGFFFQVYQPIIDGEMNIKGFEIFSRWYQKGKIFSPEELSSQIHTIDEWIFITACIIKDAIDKINYYKGKYWFSVNISTYISGSPAVLRMLESARKQLSSPELLEKLIIEFPENIDWSKDFHSIKTLMKLNEKNYQVFLDGCFSEKNFIFPVRKIKFNGYKLDLSVVNSFMDNPNDRYLIKGLVYYSHLIGSKCIAKGVDTRDKFLELKSIGVTAFQGHYISPPVLGEELNAVLTQFSKPKGFVE